jgi:hypothetical protein
MAPKLSFVWELWSSAENPAIPTAPDHAPPHRHGRCGSTRRSTPPKSPTRALWELSGGSRPGGENAWASMEAPLHESHGGQSRRSIAAGRVGETERTRVDRPSDIQSGRGSVGVGRAVGGAARVREVDRLHLRDSSAPGNAFPYFT